MNRIHRFIQSVADRQWLETIELNDWQVRKARYVLPGQYEFESEDYGTIPLDPLSSKHGITYFLKAQPEVPAAWTAGSDTIGLVFEAGGEGLLRVNGTPYHGLDRNHTYVPLNLSGIGRQPLLEIELYDPIPEPIDPLNNQAVVQPPIAAIRSKLVRVNRPVQSLLYSLKVAYDAAKLLPEPELKRMRIVEALYAAKNEVDREPANRLTDGDWVASLEAKLRASIEALMPEQRLNGVMHMVGQSHIDVAWLWPVRETVRKVSRTFSTMTTLMEEYPDFIYSQSQPLLYAFAKEHYPELYEKVKARIAEGRWELVGGMWVEPDLNIPSGESLVRQLLYGQRFYKQEFGKTSAIEWLPDTFGYCASLPQILKLAGVNYFMTSKLNWNDTNKFPYDLFHWVGIDGTSIVSYLNHGLNEHTKPKDVHEHWQSYREKGKHNEQMLLYGHGDGGGGVTREMIEYIGRSGLMTDLPESRFSTAESFFGGIAERRPALPKWHGDLYLELHRGTYTTHARNKRSNRKAEVLYRDAELWNRFAVPQLDSGKAAQELAELHDGWKLILLNQFHDIVPGTSIPEVYVTSEQEYAQVFSLGNGSLNRSLRTIVGQIDVSGQGTPYVVFNSLGWAREEVVALEGDMPWAELAAFDAGGNRLDTDVVRSGDDSGAASLAVRVPRIPAFGYTTIWVRPDEAAKPTQSDSPSKVPSSGLSDDWTVWETERYVLEFNELGEIVRWHDKTTSRELLPEGGKANELQFFHDRPTYWDAWDVDPRFEEQRAGAVELIDKQVVLRGATKDVLRFRWKLNESVISQDVILYHHQGRVDFHTNVQWNEAHKLLKVAFPVDIVTNKATYEIPFGALERPTHTNTSWEQAQFEVCGHRWADVSEGGYGVSLLNDCKYGYDIKGSTLRLSLLRAPKWPDATADQGEHEFTYSLYPHEQDWRAAHVVRAAAELNHPVSVAAGTASESGQWPNEQSLISFEGSHVLLDTVKAAEDGDGTVFRMYESSGGREKVKLTLPQSSRRALIVNLLEEPIGEAPVNDGFVELDFAPFEIKSIKFV